MLIGLSITEAAANDGAIEVDEERRTTMSKSSDSLAATASTISLGF